jgi:hypothetical protein
MKKLIAIVPLFLIFSGYAQSFTTPEINPSLISKLIIGLSKPEDVKALYGNPKETVITLEYESVQYATSNTSFSAHFGSDKKLTQYLYTANNPVSQLELSDIAIRKTRNVNSKEGIREILGIPNKIFIDHIDEAWYYEKEDNIFSLRFKKDQSISQFTYMEYNKVSTLMAADKTNLLNKETTTAEDVKKLFGLPSIKRIDRDAETWTYASPGSSLMIHFNKDLKLTDFLYNENTK